MTVTHKKPIAITWTYLKTSYRKWAKMLRHVLKKRYTKNSL